MQTEIERSRYTDLATEHAAAVFRAARSIVRNDADAADVTQETFLAVLKHPQSYLEGRDPARSLRWLAAKKALESLRRQRTRSRKEIDPMNRAEESEPFQAEQRAAKREAHRAISAGLEHLPEELRIPVILRFQNGMTFGEIAELTEVAEPSAHDRVRRGIEKLRALLTAAGFGSLALSVESQLSAAESPALPSGLESKVLSLGTAKASSIGVLTTSLGALLLTAAAFLWNQGDSLPRPPTSDRSTESLAALVPSGSVREELVTEPQVPTAPIPPASATRTSPTSVPPPPAVTLGSDAAMQRATVEGKVDLLAQDRAMLPQFRVTFLSVRDQQKGERRTFDAVIAPDGKYRIDLPVYPEGSWFRTWLEYGDATMTDAQEIELKAGETRSGLDFAFAKPLGERSGEGIVEILARDDSGNPASGLWVNLERRFEYVGSDPRSIHEGRGQTDANGRVRIPTTTLGSKQVRVFREKRSDPSAEALITFDGASSGEFVITLPAEDAICGRVTRTDRALTSAESAGLKLRAIPFTDASGHWRDISRDLSNLPSDAVARAKDGHAQPDGRFTFTGLPLDDYLITIESGGAIRAHASRRPGTAEFEIRVRELEDSEARSIRGRVLDGPTGAPIADVFHDEWLVTIPAGMSDDHVFADLLPNEMRPRVYQVAIEFDAKPTEWFTHAIEDAGRYAVVYLAGEHAPAFAGPFDLTQPKRIEDADLRLFPAATVTGRVVDANGNGVPHAWILVTGNGPISEQRILEIDAQRIRKGDEFRDGVDAETRTDAEGRFTLKGLGGAIPVRFVAVHPSFQPASSSTRTIETGSTVDDIVIHFATRR